MTPKQELRVMATVARNVLKLEQPGRNWLASWLVDEALTDEIAEAVSQREDRMMRRRLETAPGPV